ncbi:dTDP-4-dehydrorhamnose 3,5-epimerase, partial [Rhodococcus hoagii]|nr:dTDP-4-dehydrorhamnose 3,5-epimerase [Prescottella equi]
MEYRQLMISGAYEVTPRQFGDDRGVFSSGSNKTRSHDASGRPLNLAQANVPCPHPCPERNPYADAPHGQAKYITCINGA